MCPPVTDFLQKGRESEHSCDGGGDNEDEDDVNQHCHPPCNQRGNAYPPATYGGHGDSLERFPPTLTFYVNRGWRQRPPPRGAYPGLRHFLGEVFAKMRFDLKNRQRVKLSAGFCDIHNPEKVEPLFGENYSSAGASSGKSSGIAFSAAATSSSSARIERLTFFLSLSISMILASTF